MSDPKAPKPGAEPTLPLPDDLATSPLVDRPALPFVDPARWTVRGELARGGMGRILSAFDSVLGRTVAIKQALSRDLETVQRFEREAIVTSRLQHPGIVPIYEAGRSPGGEPFFVMRLVEGSSLEEELAAAKTLPARVALLPAVAAVADTIAYAHSRGIVHRDLKPANVLVGSFGDVVVVDWGLAKAHGEIGSLPGTDSLSALATSSGSILGTPSFMAPEQARGAEVDTRTDVFAVGGMLYTLLSGRAPYIGTSAREVVQAVLEGPPPDLHLLVPDANPDLVAIARKAMARDPADRYPTASELAADLRRFIRGQLVAARHYSRTELAVRWVRRHRMWLALGAVAAVAALLATVNVLRARHTVRVEAARLKEEGRRELLAGRPAAAGLLLAKSERLAPGDRITALLLSNAVHAVRSLRTGRAAHEGKVDVMVVDPTRTRLASGGEDGKIVLWSMATGQPIAETQVHSEPITWLDFSRDGTRLVSSSYDETAAVLDGVTGEVLTRLVGHGAPLNVVSISADGTRIASGDDAGVVRVWSLDGKALRTFEDHDGRAWSATWLTAKILATGDARGRLRFFDVDTGRLLRAIDAHDANLMQIALSPDGRSFATAATDGARLWTLAGEPLAKLPQEEIWDIQYSVDGKRVLTSGGPYEAIVWDAVTGRRVFGCASGARHADVNWARFSPDGTLVATAATDGTARVCAEDGRELGSLDGHGWNVSRVEWAADGSGIVTGGVDGWVRFWDVPRPSEERTLPGKRFLHGSWSPDGTLLATAGEDGEVTLWSPDGVPLHRLTGHTEAAMAAMWSPDGRRLLTMGYEHTARLWDVGSATFLRSFPTTGEAVGGFAGSRIFTGGEDGRLRYWDPETGAELSSRQLESRHLFTSGASPDGTLVLVSSVDGGLTADPGDELPSVHEGEITWVAFDRTGRRFATSGYGDSTVVVWDRATLTPQRRIPCSQAFHVSFSPDGSMLATSGRAGVDIWELSTGLQILHRDVHGRASASSEFSVDGSSLVTVGAGGARIWKLDRDFGSLDDVDRALESFRGSASLPALRGF